MRGIGSSASFPVSEIPRIGRSPGGLAGKLYGKNGITGNCIGGGKIGDRRAEYGNLFGNRIDTVAEIIGKFYRKYTGC